MPYWNKYPLRDRAGDRAKPIANLTSRGMGVPERYATSMRESAERARLDAASLVGAESAIDPQEYEGTKS